MPYGKERRILQEGAEPWDSGSYQAHPQPLPLPVESVPPGSVMASESSPERKSESVDKEKHGEIDLSAYYIQIVLISFS